MPPQCCRCNGSGSCKACVCVRNGRACTNCTPSQNGRCKNVKGALQSGTNALSVNAAIGRRICSSFVDLKGLSALVACRLIALEAYVQSAFGKLSVESLAKQYQLSSEKIFKMQLVPSKCVQDTYPDVKHLFTLCARYLKL